MPYVPAVITLMLIYIVSLLGLTNPEHLHWVFYTTFFFGIHSLALLAYHKGWNAASAKFMSATIGVGVVIELLASQVGIYGVGYQYGPSIEESLFGTTVIMAIYWFIVLYSSSSVAAKLANFNVQNKFAKAAVSGLLVVLLVGLFQQIANLVGLWFLDFSIFSYFIWFTVGFLFQLFFQRLEIDYTNRMSIYVYGGLITYLVGLIFFLK